MADAAKLKQVLLNLLINARQSLNGRGTIRVWTETDGPYTVICVGDTGCGIPAAQLERIFSPFFTTKKKERGWGLLSHRKLWRHMAGLSRRRVWSGKVRSFGCDYLVARAARP